MQKEKKMGSEPQIYFPGKGMVVSALRSSLESCPSLRGHQQHPSFLKKQTNLVISGYIQFGTTMEHDVTKVLESIKGKD